MRQIKFFIINIKIKLKQIKKIRKLTVCRFDFVDKVKSKNIDQKNKDLVLELMAIDYMKNKDDYEINLIFSNNAPFL